MRGLTESYYLFCDPVMHNQKRTMCNTSADIVHYSINKPISGSVCMACDNLLTTSRLQVDRQNLLSLSTGFDSVLQT